MLAQVWLQVVKCVQGKGVVMTAGYQVMRGAGFLLERGVSAVMNRCEGVR